MNPLVKKEIRLLLPAWIAAVLLAVASVPTPPWGNWLTGAPNIGVPLGFVLGFLLLGIASFGQELNSGSLAALLAQPMERKRIWRIKAGVLASAFIMLLFVWALPKEILFILRLHENQTPYFPFSLDAHLFLFAITIFSGSLWTTLLLRQIVAAFCLTLLAPLALTFSFELICDYFDWPNEVTPVALLVYSIAGFLWARRLFLRAQDTQWTGGNVSFSWRRRTGKTESAARLGKPRHCLFSLVSKEIHLHQGNFLIAGVILFFHLASVIVRGFHPHFKDPDIQFLLESFWFFWLLMPLLIGAAAIAEERKLGVMASQLSAPISRCVQLFAKFSVAFVLSLFLGGAMPLLIEGTKHLHCGIFAAAAIIFFIAFYASSAARATLQAIGLAIVSAVVILLYEAGISYGDQKFSDLPIAQIGLELLQLYLGVPILILAFSALITWNFKWLHVNRRLLWRNLFCALAAFASIFVLTNAIYFRVWELLEPAEPRGPAQLSDSDKIESAQGSDTFYFTLPDGRLWAKSLAYTEISNRWWQSTLLVQNRSRSEFISGSNWVDVAADEFQALGIQSDGTLWSIQRKWNPAHGRLRQEGPLRLTRIGSDANWTQCAGRSIGFLLLKNDGSLWTWGTQDYNRRNPGSSIPKKLRSDLAASPVRNGAETSWVKVFSTRNIAFAEKAGGSIWRWTGGVSTNSIPTLTVETNLGGQWSDFSFWNGAFDSFVGVKTNGQLWLYSQISTADSKTRILKIQLGPNQKWKMATSESFDHILSVRDDGTLWKWPSWELGQSLLLSSSTLEPIGPSPAKPARLGDHSDWVNLTGNWMSTFALASDGSLWAWGQPSRQVWLAPSRRPLYMGNIFQGAENKSYDPAR